MAVFPQNFKLSGVLAWTAHFAIVALALSSPGRWQSSLAISLAWLLSAFACLNLSPWHRRPAFGALCISFLLSSNAFLGAFLGFACAHSIDCL